MLVPAWCLPRRADAAEVIGAALVAMAGRSTAALEHALADSEPSSSQPSPARRGRRQKDKAALLAALREDAYQRGMSIRPISDRRGVGRRTVLQALESPIPRPRKRLPPRRSQLDPFKDTIDEILRQDLDHPHRRRRTVKHIPDELTTQHGMTGVSYSTLRGYIANRRSITPPPPRMTTDIVPAEPPGHPARRNLIMSWSPAHNAVEHEDLPRLRELLDAGHDVEDDHGDEWTLLRHAIDVEYDGHVQTGKPLHADVTAFLLARGADPLHRCNGMTVVDEAEIRGHWLAAGTMRAWIRQAQHSGES